jgi:hypothetical protein
MINVGADCDAAKKSGADRTPFYRVFNFVIKPADGYHAEF